MQGFEQLEAVLCEIELSLSNRLLTFTYEIGDELLKPSYLIHGRRLNTISINQSEEEHTHFDDTFICFSKMLVDFSSNKEYLLQLGEYFKDKHEKY